MLCVTLIDRNVKIKGYFDRQKRYFDLSKFLRVTHLLCGGVRVTMIEETVKVEGFFDDKKRCFDR